MKYCVPLGSLLLAMVCLLGQPAQAQMAVATGAVTGLNLHFTLGGDVSVSPGTTTTIPFTDGMGSLGSTGVQFDILPQGAYSIALQNGPITATAGPNASQSDYEQEVDSSFVFTNRSTDPIDVTINWDASYLLSALGDSSLVFIEVDTDVDAPSGSSSLPLFFDFLFNDDAVAPTVSDTYTLTLDPATLDSNLNIVPVDTTFTLSASVVAFAVVPESDIAWTWGLGVVSLGIFLARRRQKRPA